MADVDKECCTTLNLTPLADLLQEKRVVLPVVDLRAREDYTREHFTGSTCLPADAFMQRTHELPPRGRSVSVVFSEMTDVVADCLLYLRTHGYSVRAAVRVTAEHWATARGLDVVTSGAHSTILWEPNPCLGACISLVEDALNLGQSGPVSAPDVVQDGAAPLSPAAGLLASAGWTDCLSEGRPLALDVACGSGRDAVYLALRGWQVLGLDYLARQIDRATQFAADAAATPWVEFHNRNVEKDGGLVVGDAQGRPLSFHLVHVARYLHRPLFKELKRIVRPGGLILFHTFMRGCEVFGRPRKAEFLLEPGELAGMFEDWIVLCDRVESISDGRPTSFFVAQRPR
mmetsp:Transcript_17767/g.50013  ORF Transcript_17767/g.50013 Transcript_17767/m.50013 type:complete len:344 (-) Transcript_17767:390-1421(-)